MFLPWDGWVEVKAAMKLLAEASVIAAAVVVMVMAIAVKEVTAARILIAHPIGTRSHKNLFMAIAEKLTQRNHTVSGTDSTPLLESDLCWDQDGGVRVSCH